MDPQETLTLLMRNVKEEKWAEAFMGLETLFHHLKKGGHAPMVPECTYITVGTGGLVAYSILSKPSRIGGATFTRYEYSRDSQQMEDAFKYEMPGFMPRD